MLGNDCMYTSPERKRVRGRKKRKKKRKKVGEKEGGKEKQREIKNILQISEWQKSIWVMSIAERIRIIFPGTRKCYS